MHMSSGFVIFSDDKHYNSLLQFRAMNVARWYKLQFRNGLTPPPPPPVSKATGSPAIIEVVRSHFHRSELNSFLE